MAIPPLRRLTLETNPTISPRVHKQESHEERIGFLDLETFPLTFPVRILETRVIDDISTWYREHGKYSYQGTVMEYLIAPCGGEGFMWIIAGKVRLTNTRLHGNKGKVQHFERKNMDTIRKEAQNLALDP